MGSYIAIKGQTLSINLLDDLRDNGWVISGGKAIHSGCNPGFIELLGSNYTIGVPNEFEYKVVDYTNGYVNVQVGSSVGNNISSNNESVKEVFTPQVNDKVRFYSNGNLAIKVLSISPVLPDGTSNGITLGFYEKDNKWGGNYSYLPETMIRFVNSFFTFKSGELWRHNQNVLRNNFYGEQYTSKIVFYVNLSPDEVKNFFSMRQKSNKVWTASNNDDIYIYPSEGKPNGQSSRLKMGRFKRLNNGDWFVDFLRDISDPRFMNEQDALRNGSLLQGNVMRVTLENDSAEEVRLLSVDVIVGTQQYTY